MPNPTIASLLYPGCTARIIGHLELCNSLSRPRPVDKTRWPGYDQHTPAHITAHCQRIKSLGFDVVMPNTYSIGSWENTALSLYLPAIQSAGLGLIINIDKGVYASAPSPIAAIRQYLLWLRAHALCLPNYEKWQGKYVITFFVNPDDSPAMFRQVEAENPDCVFVYNDATKGTNTMWWVTQSLETGLDLWCQAHATSSGLQIPGVSPGFDDSLTVNGKPMSVWATSTTPARVWPAGVGPNATTLGNMFARINRYYSVTNQPAYIQVVTLNDWDERTAVEPHADGTGGFFSVPTPPVTVSRGEVWMDGVKLSDVPPGLHQITTQQVMSDGTVEGGVVTSFKV